MRKYAIDLDVVKKLYSFDIEDHPTNHKIQYLNFYTEKDGVKTTTLKYKFQHPGMMDVHSLVYDSENTETDAFRLGLKRLFSENDSPKIDEEYFETHPEDMSKWSLIVRGLLFRRWDLQP